MAALDNADFETATQGDEIPGWTVAAGMGSQVAIDPAQPHSGRQSVKLTSVGQPATITSPPFSPPTTGRVAVHMYLRGGAAGLPSLRISLEGQRADGPFAPYGVIPAAAASESTLGWVRYSFPVDDVPSEGLSALRVRFDLASAGELWIDDVEVFDLPFNPSERLELSKLISLASVKLEAGQLADCARLLEGYWPQFLLAYVPLTNTSAADRRAPHSTANRARPGPQAHHARELERIHPQAAAALSGRWATRERRVQVVWNLTLVATSVGGHRAGGSADGRPTGRRGVRN